MKSVIKQIFEGVYVNVVLDKNFVRTADKQLVFKHAEGAGFTTLAQSHGIDTRAQWGTIEIAPGIFAVSGWELSPDGRSIANENRTKVFLPSGIAPTNTTLPLTSGEIDLLRQANNAFADAMTNAWRIA